MMLVDGLREDFVSFGDPQKITNAEHNFLKDNEDGAYKGKKISIFQELKASEPENTVLMPLRAEMPTVTTVRVKSIMTGSISSFFETKEEFSNELV